MAVIRLPQANSFNALPNLPTSLLGPNSFRDPCLKKSEVSALAVFRLEPLQFLAHYGEPTRVE